MTRVPEHICIVMDGNGRWAKRRLMPRSYGHRKGMDRMIGLLEHAYDIGVPYVTVYALSTENLERPKEELDGLFDLIRTHFAEYMKKICARGVRLRILGDPSLLPADVAEKGGRGFGGIRRQGAEHRPRLRQPGGDHPRGEHRRVPGQNAHRRELCGSFIYGRTARSRSRHPHGKGKADLQLPALAGGVRGILFSDKMFPEFSDGDFDEAMEAFSKRVRRFGKTDEQL